MEILKVMGIANILKLYKQFFFICIVQNASICKHASLNTVNIFFSTSMFFLKLQSGLDWQEKCQIKSGVLV